MIIVISSGHGKYIRGASGYLDEVDEARRVVARVGDLLNASGHPTKTYNDDISRTQSENLNRIVSYHNSQARDLDISVHFNAYKTTSSPMGTECLYVTQQALSAKVSSAIAGAGSLINRGAKKRTDLYFLNNTAKPAILIEVCFVDSSADANLYRTNFEPICLSIVQAVTGQSAVVPPEPPVTPTPPTTKPTIKKGSTGPAVRELQAGLNSDNGAGLVVDGDFGSLTDTATRNYQASRNLTVDGICGPQTWAALDAHAPPYTPPGLPAPLSSEQQSRIMQIAASSAIATYSWRDRGRAPAGYTKGFALSFANTYRQLLLDYPPAVETAKARTTNSKDVLQVYASQFAALGMDNGMSGPGTLRHLWALMMGLGMRESSGRHCEGRDMSASNVTSDTAEAGLYQTSYNARSCSSNFGVLYDAYNAGKGTDNPQGFLTAFEEGVSCSSSSWQNYGSGAGANFQAMRKNQPSFAAATCAVVLRSLCNHYGPINRGEAELRREADAMLEGVQSYIDSVFNEEVGVAEEETATTEA